MEHGDREYGGSEHIYLSIFICIGFSHLYSAYLIRAIEVLANHIMQECL